MPETGNHGEFLSGVSQVLQSYLILPSVQCKRELKTRKAVECHCRALLLVIYRRETVCVKRVGSVRWRNSNSGLTRSFRKFNYSRRGTQLQAKATPPKRRPAQLRSDWPMRTM